MKENSDNKISFEEAVDPMIRYYSNWLIELDRKDIISQYLEELKIRKKAGEDNDDYCIQKFINEM